MHGHCCVHVCAGYSARMHYPEWSASRVAAALAELADSGMPQSRLARLAGVNRSQINRWSRGENRPGYDPVRRLAAGIWRTHPRLAKELVVASGYAWAEPVDAPEPDPLADYFGEEKAARLRRVLSKRGEAGAIVLAELEREFSRPSGEPAQDESGPSRAAS